MVARKRLPRKEVVRLARQKLWTDIGKAVDSYERHVYGDNALTAPKKQSVKEQFEEAYSELLKGKKLTDKEWAEMLRAVPELLSISDEPEDREGDITDPAAILPPESKKRRGSRARKTTPIGAHIRGETFSRAMGEARAEMNLGLESKRGSNDDDEDFDRGGAARAESEEVSVPNPMGLGTSEEKVLILIVQSAGGMTPAQIAIQIALKKRTIQNILTSLKSQRFIIKDENHGKFRATEEGKTAVKGRTSERVKGAILEKLSETERKVLFAIGSKKEGITLSAISVMVPGVKKRTKQNILTKLKTMELIEKNEDRYALTEHALDELKGKLEKPLTGKALRTKLIETLPEPEAVVIEWLSYDGG